MRGSTGQGATEYLVLLAVVLIIGLVSIALLGFFPGISGGVSEAESQAYWGGIARPIRVNGAFSRYGGNICGIAGGTSGYIINIENIDVGSIVLTGVYVNNTLSSGVCVPGSPYASSLRLGSSEKATIYVREYYCSAGETVSLPLGFRYDSQYLPSRVENGTKRYVFKCDPQPFS